MSAQRAADREEYVAATTIAREVRANVAEQLRALVIEGDRNAGDGEVTRRIQLVHVAAQRVRGARARQKRARELGLPVAPEYRLEREMLELLRESLMQLAVACAGFVAQMDLAKRFDS